MDSLKITLAKKTARAELARRYREEYIRYIQIKEYQKPFVMSAAQIDSVIGGNRSGKTFTGGYRFTCIVLGELGISKYGLPRLPIVYPDPPFTSWVISEDFLTSREVAQPILELMLPKTAIKKISHREKSAIDYIELIHGVRVLFRSSAEGWRKFQGADIPVVWFDEETYMDIWREVLIRVGKQKRYFIITMTPLQGLTELYETLMDEAAKPNSGYEVHKYFTIDNDELQEGELDLIKSAYPEDEWLTRFEGEPLEKSGRVYSTFRKGVNVYPGDTYDFGALFESLDWYFFCDYGLDMPMAIYLVALDGRGIPYIHKEHYVAGESLEYHAEAVKRMISDYIPHSDGRIIKGHYLRFMYADPSMFDGEKDPRKRTLKDKFAFELRKIGVKLPIRKGNNDVDYGIQIVRSMLMSKEEHYNPFSGEMNGPGLWISRECVKWIWEGERYRWHISRSGSYEQRKPRKKDDHAMDATRYGCTGILGLSGGRKQQKKQRSAIRPGVGRE